MRFSVSRFLGPVLILSAVILFTGQRLYEGMLWQAMAAMGFLPDALSLDLTALLSYGGSAMLLLLGLALSLIGPAAAQHARRQQK